MTIIEQPIYNYVDVRVLDKVTGDPTELLANGITMQIQRGNDAGVAGLASVEVGSALITLLDPAIPVYDPTTTSLLQPNMVIEVYQQGDPTNPIFTGVILDLSTRYQFDPVFTDKLLTYVDIYAVDAVSEWGGKVYPDSSYPVSGVSGEPATSEPWSDRITRIKDSLATVFDNNSVINPPNAIPDVLLYENASGWS